MFFSEVNGHCMEIWLIYDDYFVMGDFIVGLRFSPFFIETLIPSPRKLPMQEYIYCCSIVTEKHDNESMRPNRYGRLL